MRLSVFQHLMNEVPAIYWSHAPLFALDQGRQPVQPGSYATGEGDPTIRFEPRERHYIVSGGATPDTVALIPIAGQSHAFVFQQSDGRDGMTFYGVLALFADAQGFLLFSPESRRPTALDAARGNDAVLDVNGCRFATREALLAALVPIAMDYVPDTWNSYRRS